MLTYITKWQGLFPLFFLGGSDWGEFYFPFFGLQWNPWEVHVYTKILVALFPLSSNTLIRYAWLFIVMESWGYHFSTYILSCRFGFKLKNLVSQYEISLKWGFGFVSKKQCKLYVCITYICIYYIYVYTIYIFMYIYVCI